MTSKYSGATKAFDVCLFTGYYGIKMAAQLGFVLVYQAGWVGGYFWRVRAVVVAKGFRCVFPKKMMYSHVYMHMHIYIYKRAFICSIQIIIQYCNNTLISSQKHQTFPHTTLKFPPKKNGPRWLVEVANEIYPAEARTLGCGICLAGGRLAAMLGPLFFEGILLAEKG